MIDVNYDDYAYYDRAIEALWFNTIDLLKESLESVGIDLGETNNIIEYKNYLISEPLEFVEYVYIDGAAYGPGGIDITGKSVGIVGDSWFDKKPIIKFISDYITEKGGSVVIKGYLAGRNGVGPLANDNVPKGEGYTVSAGATWAGYRLFEPVANCDIVISELNINNVETAAKNKNWLINHMKHVKGMLKAQTVICWGMPVVSWTTHMTRQQEGDMAVKTNAATSEGCTINGWKYINPHDASHWKAVCDACSQPGVYHIDNKLSKEYFGEMLDLSFMRAGLYSGGSLGMTGSLAMFTDSLDCLNLAAFDPYDAYDPRQKGWIRIRQGVINRSKMIPNLLNLASEEFKSTAKAVGHAEGVPPILFLFIAASEGSLRNSSGAHGYQYSGYFGQAGGGGAGASLETQMKAELPKKYHDLIALGYSPVEALALSYVVHHLPVMFKLKKFFGNNIWSTNPKDLENILRTTHEKGGGGPMTKPRLAESMLCHLYSPWAASYIARHQNQYKDFL